MNVNFYLNNSFDNVLNKNLTLSFSLNLVLRYDFNLHNAKIMINTSEDVESVNYCFINEVGRYYFIESIDKVAANLYSLELVCDYLMTFKNEINSNQFDFKTPIGSGDFGEVKVNSTGAVEVVKIDSDFTFSNGNTYMLNVLGDF
ncbi:hypothetical protein VPHK58G2_0006 [Vibrio phage K58 g2]